MKFVKWLLIVLAFLVGLFVVITFFLPKDYYVERSIEIEAPALLVYAQVVDLEAWQTWNPWNDLDPDMALSYGDPTVGKGASYSWVSEVTGDGTMEIIEAISPLQVRYKMTFEGYEDEPGFSSMLLDAANPVGPTRVTWTFEGEVGDRFFAPWLGIMMDTLLGPSYEKGLASLKERCEAMTQTIPGLP